MSSVFGVGRSRIQHLHEVCRPTLNPVSCLGKSGSRTVFLDALFLPSPSSPSVGQSAPTASHASRVPHESPRPNHLLQRIGVFIRYNGNGDTISWIWLTGVYPQRPRIPLLFGERHPQSHKNGSETATVLALKITNELAMVTCGSTWHIDGTKLVPEYCLL